MPRKQRSGLRGLLRGAVESGGVLLPGLLWDTGSVPLRGKTSALLPPAVSPEGDCFPSWTPSHRCFLYTRYAEEKESPCKGGSAASASRAKPHLVSPCCPPCRSKQRGRAETGWGDPLHSFPKGLRTTLPSSRASCPQLLRYLHMECLSDLLVHVVGERPQERFCRCLIRSLKDKRQREPVRLEQGVGKRACRG